mmetsp:Transcript_24394/g.68552  ORF Transcript_24394/g.68552 Transcript_24394/m.68552 type:complete len:129 (-) Transcript_24394:263-649(-)|eukprot:CAMPEP_0119554748 /NCGR_PEP_ID=MMETSP1352-20130426/7141_1 /TAXON_ID=265584 /ORGANISM="Stauroneis constricta, Strain CCMP1120" /LENGTH=128 /DNA_ID=CAMNT_0007601379 /DNA_START=116 /DNA_END=502 /DNA_ORIENTATION=+
MKSVLYFLIFVVAIASARRTSNGVPATEPMGTAAMKSYWGYPYNWNFQANSVLQEQATKKVEDGKKHTEVKEVKTMKTVTKTPETKKAETVSNKKKGKVADDDQPKKHPFLFGFSSSLSKDELMDGLE